jgi:hypothetical protein
MQVSSIIRKIPKSVILAVLIVLGAKLLIFGVGYAADVLHNGSEPAFNVLTNMFNRWDAPHYLYLAQHWYDGNPANDQYNFIVFFPLYPLLVNLFTVDFNYVNVSALVVSNVCSIVAFVYLYKLVRLDFDSGVAQKALLLLSIFPTAYFLSAPYTEGLFFALIIASLYYARLGKWALAGILSFFAALTRLSGLLMFPVLLVEFLHQKGRKPTEMLNRNQLWISLVLAGFLIYLNINNQVTGNPFTFMEIERVHWYNTLNPLEGLKTAIAFFNKPFPDNITTGYAPIAFAAFGLATIAVGFIKRFRPSYMACMILSWMLAVSTSFWISVPRYIMAMFPMFILFATLTRRKTVNFAIVAAFGVGLIFFTALFAIGWWAF